MKDTSVNNADCTEGGGDGCKDWNTVNPIEGCLVLKCVPMCCCPGLGCGSAVERSMDADLLNVGVATLLARLIRLLILFVHKIR